ncbi:leucyl aminopeptidase [Aliidongia dinghuensis]|uniref:Leucyl aminopeptidase n=1 Tax=Aliidongia dinghuensis TaxID=1867774 RepID=A0A8J3E2A9_9PROT|nr:leucyl aminopeptidase [Aliidongia dinghuensis]
MVDTLIDGAGGIPIMAVTTESFGEWKAGYPGAVAAWLAATGFTGEAGKTALVPGPDGHLSMVVQGVAADEPLWALAGLPDSLPEGTYRLGFDSESLFGKGAGTRVALGWALGSYVFSRYKAPKRKFAQLVWPESADRATVTALADGLTLARDLINTPTEDMGPAELAQAAATLAERHGAKTRLVVGDELLTNNYPTIHAVGRASDRAPRLIDITWGKEDAPKLTLVGKGVCFDSGGLDIKPASGMKLMKKDMGGAATVLGLAHAVMASGLNVRLRVLVPAVENAISGNAFRPMDVFKTRKGLTVEIGNTDAEGRLILCDALAEATTEEPALLIDMATLTGAARVALGPELPVMFSNDDTVAAELLAAGTAEADPLWRLPLWKPYRKYLDSKIADINNASDSGFAGAITAALYLQEFVSAKVSWVHIDTFAWNQASRAGRPEGGEGLALRALYHLIQKRFS